MNGNVKVEDGKADSDISISGREEPTGLQVSDEK